jgi:hypothetical protein
MDSMSQRNTIPYDEYVGWNRTHGKTALYDN